METKIKPKNKNLFLSAISSFSGFIRDKDEYGHPILLNYKGDDTYKTLPGGILSIIAQIILLFYGILRVRDMVDKVNWSITQQIVVADLEEINVPQAFSELKNISMGIQMSPKRPK